MANCDISCKFDERPENPKTCKHDVKIPPITGDIPRINMPVINPPTSRDITEEVLNGKGVFDAYMRAGKAHLDEEYNKGRIKGSDYTQAYIATIQLMMSQSNQFVLEVYKAETQAKISLVQAEIAAKMFPYQYLGAAYDAALKEAQAKKMKHDSDMVCQQIAELKANGGVERALKRAQKQVQIMQAKLYERQILSFREKTKIDAAKTIYDAWAVNAVEEPDATTWALNELQGKMPLMGDLNTRMINLARG